MPADDELRSSARGRRVTEQLARRMSRHTDRVWTRNDIGRALVDALVETGFDWKKKPSAIEEVTRLLIATYRIAWRTIPPERLRLDQRTAVVSAANVQGDFTVTAARKAPGRRQP